ncbi:uncharacterized protein SPPG_08051 [Spizellomyces punctatus DAOM BR117]|uniref:Phospholipid/glycerol acyltransferase domain-containing protein n=1 Tax=Spizellomyces punctatus (strain DAOM BR117) TaxID=645134 RepID=A0A0L0H6V0_SPIPD|nr:uncharacterized protein SPPG_08051 [Spizellomyces punctatus DAOM BR117]KNC96458.1 hypothetical protein SPPG_08051 [Spizellomyces punctatus DAOM BR117]|eukprot:XP_016604498.1 hypothetical protein SPPG_08051 [Spizellomyces punctatus DAOM BR117]
MAVATVSTLLRWLFKFYCKAFLLSWGSRIRYHGKKPQVSEPHIFVANHTSVIDYLVLSAHDFPHATVAQKHGGVIGYFEDKVLTLNGSLMFNRNEKNDRSVLAEKMRQHVQNPKNVPLLIFPEGTCVNNEYTVLFHKGAFDLDAAVAPVAIKYNKRWADAYWHSKTQTFTKHLLYLMTRWGLVADVWYLPPRTRKPGQSAVEFANEVKAEISAVAHLKNLSWDGYFKNFAPAKEKQVRLQEHPQTRYGVVLMNRMRNRPTPDRMGHLRRSASISIGAEASLKASRDVAYAKPDWMDPTKESTTVKNEILVALEDHRSTEMIDEISHKKNDVVKTWKRYTKMRSADVIQRRIENSSWRLWFKRRIQQEASREKGLTHTLDDEESLSLSMLSAYNLMAYFPPSLFSPPVESSRPRSRSMGTRPLRSTGFPWNGMEDSLSESDWKRGHAPMVPAR